MSQPAQGVTYEFDHFQVDPGQRLLRSRVDGEPIPLTSKAFETLLYLVENHGALVEKTALMKAVWPNVVVEENNLNQSISAVRRALGESALEHRFIVTVPGRGYRFVAPVRQVIPSFESSTGSTPTSSAPPARHDSIAVTAKAPVDAPSVAWYARHRVAILTAAMILAVGGVWLALRSQDRVSSSEAPRTLGADSAMPTPAGAKLRLAVLPFENLSPDPANAFFTDGLHEEILSTLARRAPDLQVISRTTMMGYRLRPKPVPEVAKELSASHLLEGSVRREQNKVRLTLQLIDARTDRNLWSHNYDRTLSDALTLQSEVAAEVAAQLSVQLAGGATAEADAPKNPEAYDLYLKGLLARQFVTPLAPVERYQEVDDLFSRAIALDPSFAQAYAQRSTFRGAMFAFNYDASEDQVRRIREDVNAGLKLAPEDPQVLAAEALYWSWVERDLPRALATFEAAEAARLADPMFLSGKSALLLRMGRAEEAVQTADRLVVIDPGNPFILATTAVTLAMARLPVDALRRMDRLREQFPDSSSIAFSRANVVFGYTGRTEEMRAALDRANRELPAAVLLDQNFWVLRIERRYDAMQKLFNAFPESSTRVTAGPGASSFFGVGNRPTALFRGWAALLKGDSQGAARQGREVLEFVARQNETGRNAWFLRLLQSQGHTLIGQRELAIAAAHEALEQMPPSRDVLSWLSVAYGAAASYAWSGAEANAVSVLEQLATTNPGFGPAYIARDPFFTVPLAKNARYGALVERLEAQMRSTEL